MRSSKRHSELKNFISQKGGILLCGLLMAMMILSVPPASFAVIQKGQPAPPFKVNTTSGQAVTLANYKGRVLVIDFFASWCQPCTKSIPHIIELNRKYAPQGLQVLGLSLDEDKDDLIDFITPKKLNYPVALANEELQTDYGLHSIPTLVLIDKKGVVVEKYMGLTDETAKKIEAAIKRLLAE
jgi:cytochrome c biogenesis protein CcmG, thiol:disulfide interchange protein DsbE